MPLPSLVTISRYRTTPKDGDWSTIQFERLSGYQSRLDIYIAKRDPSDYGIGGGCGNRSKRHLSDRHTVTIAPSINNGVTYPPIDLVPTANVVVTDFSLSISASTPAPVTVPSGTPAVFTVTATSTQYGFFTNPVALSCQANGLPPGAMCVFSPATITPSVTSSGNTTESATSTLTIYTSGVVGQMRHRAQASRQLPWSRPLLLGLVLLVGVGRLSRRSRSVRGRWWALVGGGGREAIRDEVPDGIKR